MNKSVDENRYEFAKRINEQRSLLEQAKSNFTREQDAKFIIKKEWIEKAKFRKQQELEEKEKQMIMEKIKRYEIEMKLKEEKRAREIRIKQAELLEKNKKKDEQTEHINKNEKKELKQGVESISVKSLQSKKEETLEKQENLNGDIETSRDLHRRNVVEEAKRKKIEKKTKFEKLLQNKLERKISQEEKLKLKDDYNKLIKQQMFEYRRNKILKP